jgi:hypothetical protein
VTVEAPTSSRFVSFNISVNFCNHLSLSFFEIQHFIHVAACMQVLNGGHLDGFGKFNKRLGNRCDWSSICHQFASVIPNRAVLSPKIYDAGHYGSDSRAGVSSVSSRDTYMGVSLNVGGHQNAVDIISAAGDDHPIILLLDPVNMSCVREITSLVTGGDKECVEGRSASIVLLEKGSVVAGSCRLNPYNQTIVAVDGAVAVFVATTNSESLVVGKSDIDLFSQNRQCQALIEKGFKPWVFKLKKGESLHVESGCYCAEIALENSGDYTKLC